MPASRNSTDKARKTGYSGGKIATDVHASRAGEIAAAFLQSEFDCLKLLAAGRPVERLSPRETLVLGLKQRGLTIKEIAAKCNISVSTVKYHFREIGRKLQTHSAQEAIYVVSQAKAAAA